MDTYTKNNKVVHCWVMMQYDHNKKYCVEHCKKRKLCSLEKKQYLVSAFQPEHPTQIN